MNLNTALSIAVSEFSGRKDKAGEPYILHLLRVMLAMDTEEEMIVAVLHDLLEDIPDWTEQRLQDAGFDDHIVYSISLLTREKHMTYNEYIQRIHETCSQPALKVKIEDLKDNLRRLPNLYYRDKTKAESLAKRYIAALALLAPSQDL